MKKGEFGLIDGIRSMFPAPEGVGGIGDDCAVIPQKDGMETLVSTDMLVEGTHFLFDRVSPYQLGWKSAAVNISDIAAMGGSPVGSFLAFALPRDIQDGWVDEFMRGYADISRLYGFPLLGGDTTASPDRLSICVTVLGQAPAGRSIRRSGALPGDLVCVTGTLGDSAAGLEVLLRDYPQDDRMNACLVGRHYLPKPRMAEGQSLAQSDGVHAMMDISDGIGSDLEHIAEESSVGMIIEADSVPVSPQLEAFCSAHGIDPLKLAIGGGEDYELLFTVDAEAEKRLKVPHFVIGRVVEGSGITWNGCDGGYVGYRHF